MDETPSFLPLNEMSEAQINCLDILEKCALHHGGKVHGAALTEAEHAIIEIWRSQNLIKFGFLPLPKNTQWRVYNGYTHWVVLSPQAKERLQEWRLKRMAKGEKELAKQFLR